MKIIITLVLSQIILFSSFGKLEEDNKFMPPSEAFKTLINLEDSKIIVSMKTAKDIHIYKKSLKLYISEPKHIDLQKYVNRLKTKILDGFEIFEKSIINIEIPIKDINNLVSGTVKFNIEFQGCSDNGICYQTIKEQKIFDIKENLNISFIQKIMNLISGADTNQVKDTLENENFIFIIFIFFIFGLLLSFTPCIFPMIPILSSIIVSHSKNNKNIKPKETFIISLIYVLSMAITYTIVGTLAGILGGVDIQASFQNPIVISIFSTIFIALAFSLFGYYEIKLPSKVEDKINKITHSHKGKGLISVVIMGFLSAFIIGPCVAPPLAGAVIFIAQTGDAFLGALSLFVMSIGLGFPLLLIGLGAGKFMPKPGGWMIRISHIFGVIMLGLGIFMISKIVPIGISLFLWSIFFIGISLYLQVFDNRHTAMHNPFKLFSKILAFLFLIYGSSLFIGLLTGASSIFTPFERFTTNNVTNSNKLTHIDKKKYLNYSLKRLKNEIRNSKKPVIVKFTKDSCVSCEELEKWTFSDIQVKEEMKKWTMLIIDVTNNTEEDKNIMKYYKIFGTPNILFFDSNNNYLSNKLVTGYVKADKFLTHLKRFNIKIF